jgi:PAS domain S-box-containing protein
MGSSLDKISQLEADAAVLLAENAELRCQLELRNHALDSTPTFFLISALTRPECVVYCNKAVADQLGLPREEIIGRPLSVLTQWVGRNPTYRADVWAALRAGHTFRYEDEVRRSDGSTFWLGVSTMPLHDARGRLTHAVTVGADITAKREEALKKQALQDKLVEEMRRRELMGNELQVAQKLESVGRLAAGIAHEINTPTQFIGDNVSFVKDAVAEVFAAIDQIADTLERSGDGTVPGATLAALLAGVDMEYFHTEVPRAIEQSMEGIARIQTIVGAMKDFSHPAVDRTPIDINRAIASTITVATNEWKYVAEVKTEFDLDLPSVPVMPGMFNQVILNLIVNAAHAIADAAKAAAHKGTITVSTRQVQRWAEVRVSDTGCGIPEAIRDRIFDPFFTTKPVGKGTGQGLAIAHDAIINKHRGAISVESAVGEGTTFIVRLPLDPENVEITSAA